ncbi:MAG: LysM peptidoglycan-binding domain-containing protein [Anaerolineae bacterium]|nr:LysM peptidoglycan-binding domain-containing protein [Anaerolineae bacterium]
MGQRLARRTRFAMLDHIGRAVGKGPLEAVNSFLERIAANRTEGGWVVISSALANRRVSRPAWLTRSLDTPPAWVTMAVMKKHILAACLAALCLLVTLPACEIEPQELPASPTAATPGVEATPTPQPATPSPTSPPAPTAIPTATPTAVPTAAAHTVQPGDTLIGLALAYDVPIAAIQLGNGLGDSTLLHAGQVLTIPPAAEWAGASPFWVLHVVQPGETLVGIARAYDLEAGALQEVNRLANADALGVGQELVLPLDGPAVIAAAPAPTATPLPPPPDPTVSVTATATSSPPAPPPAPPPGDVAGWAYETARIINEVRARHGLPPFAYNELLATAAQGQANDCSQRGWCSHTGSDGADLRTRIIRAGYAPSGWAECWAMSLSPQHAVDMWMDEVPPNDPHRRTLLSTWVTEIGLGIAGASWDYYYFIADFGRP